MKRNAFGVYPPPKDGKLLPCPTAAPPGSEEKICVLCKRYERHEFLHHVADVKISWSVLAVLESIRDE